MEWLSNQEYRKMRDMKKIFGIYAAFVILLVLASSCILADTLQPIITQRLKYGPTLYISDIRTIPPNIVPGSSSTLFLHLENIATYPLRDIIIKLELPAQFAPADINKKKIRSLEGLDSTETSFDILALPDAAEGIYKVPISVSYIDEIGTSYSENDTISLRISQEPRLFAEVASSELYEGNLLGKISIKIANIGVGNIKFMVVELRPSENKEYEIVGLNKEYIGEISSDDYDTVEFKIKSNLKTGMTNLNLNIAYTDANNQEYSKIVQIPLRIITASEAGVKPKSNSFLWILVLLLVLYIVYRQFRKRMKKRQNAK
ncbi:MAG: hypothetical protein V1886_03355 [archaeon]